MIRVNALKSTPQIEHMPYVSMIIIVTFIMTIKPETRSKPSRIKVSRNAGIRQMALVCVFVLQVF